MARLEVGAEGSGTTIFKPSPGSGQNGLERNKPECSNEASFLTFNFEEKGKEDFSRELTLSDVDPNVF